MYLSAMGLLTQGVLPMKNISIHRLSRHIKKHFLFWNFQFKGQH